MKICIIASRFNEPIVSNLIEGAYAALQTNGIAKENVSLFRVPGAFEIPVMLKKMCSLNLVKKYYDGFITIGCVIKGETAHFEYISNSVVESINKISYEFEIPLGFCVLTCFTPQQAYERSIVPAEIENNKGFEAALAMLEMIHLLNIK